MNRQAIVHEVYPDALDRHDDSPVTSYLDSPPPGRTHEDETASRATDWLALLTSSDLQTAVDLDDDTLAQLPAPSGMIEHLSPVRLRPTPGARITTGFRRGILMAVLGALSIATVSGGAYTVYTTGWLDSWNQLSPATSQQSNNQQANPPAPGSPANSVLPTPAQVASGSPTEMRNRGMEQLRSGNYKAASDLLQSAIDAGGGDAVTYYQLGLAFMGSQSGGHAAEDAEMAFRSAVSLEPTWPAPKQLLAESLMRRGFYNEAIGPAREAVQLDPSRTDTWLTLGRAYEGAGNKAEATKAYAEASRLAPAPPTAP